MRVSLPGIRRSATRLAITFDGEPIEAAPGETVAAALINAGVWSFRQTRSGSARGPFCGMGVCGECLVVADGISRRACLEPARPGLVVASHPAQAEAPAAVDRGPQHSWRSVSPDVLVIGAGPGGLSAAIAAAEAGLDVLVVDERKKPGGQYFKQPADGFAVTETELDPQFREGRALIARAEAACASILRGATVWGAFSAGEIAVATGEGTLMVQARRIVLSPGAYERAVPFPGWTLPGVLTTGAAQTLLRATATAPGRRVLIAGNGPLNLQVADELSEAGVEVVAVAELAGAPGPAALASLVRMFAAAPSLVSHGIGHLRRMRRKRVPILYRRAVVRIEQAAPGLDAFIAEIGRDGFALPGTKQRFAVDAVCMGYGFLPQSELARALGCRHHYDPSSGGLAVERADNGRTSVAEIFVVGDAGGLGGARVALAQGLLAGAAVARELGRELATALEREVATARRTLARSRRFQAALWSLHSAPLITHQLATPDTLVCRCEDVDRRTAEAHFADEIGSVGALKRASRAGMGRCQGRYCGTVLAAIAARQSGGAIDEMSFFAPRTPFKPTPIGQLADPPPGSEALANIGSHPAQVG